MIFIYCLKNAPKSCSHGLDLKNNKWNASFKNITILVPSLVIQTTFFSYCIKAIAEKTSAHMLLSI